MNITLKRRKKGKHRAYNPYKQFSKITLNLRVLGTNKLLKTMFYNFSYGKRRT